MDKKFVKKLQGKKLSTLVEKYGFCIDDFMDENTNEMSRAQYEMLKNHKVTIEFLENDFNYNYIVTVENFDAYCVYN